MVHRKSKFAVGRTSWNHLLFTSTPVIPPLYVAEAPQSPPPLHYHSTTMAAAAAASSQHHQQQHTYYLFRQPLVHIMSHMSHSGILHICCHNIILEASLVLVLASSLLPASSSLVARSLEPDQSEDAVCADSPPLLQRPADRLLIVARLFLDTTSFLLRN